MAARVLKFRLPDQEPEPFLDEPDLTSCVVEDLGRWAQQAIESYTRASWYQLTEPIRREKLALARLLIERLEDLESGRCDRPTFGD